MKVKICGITDVQTGLKAVEYGADAIGFVFAESKRKVPAELAGEISRQLPNDCLKVGVFVNESREEMERIAKIAGLTHVQVHGDETADLCRALTLPVIKSVSIESNQDIEEMKEFPCEFLLLDGPKGKYRGGNGTAFAWDMIQIDHLQGKKIILAGGLTAANVDEGIKTIQPYMVDVSSGVETDGKKDLNKIYEFINKAKGIRRN